MSLRIIHIFFILTADLVCSFFGIWGIQKNLESKNALYLTLGIGSLVISFFLVIYLILFIKKTKGLNP